MLFTATIGLSQGLNAAAIQLKARKICEGLTGVVCDPSLLKIMTGLLDQNAPLQAALAAIDFNDSFYRKLKNQVHPLSNEDRVARGNLNSFTALIVGMTRDQIPFDQVLYGDIIYTAEGGSNGGDLRPFSIRNNLHYDDAEMSGQPYKTMLVKKTQSELGMFSPEIASGILTTPTFGQQYFLAGTNRAVLAETYDAFLCHKIEQLHDNTRPKQYISKDVTHSPGGDPSVYLKTCSGCHAGMDAQRPAFWGWDYVENVGLQFDPTRRLTKLVRNTDQNPNGFEMKDNAWVNLWTEGKNANLGWNGKTEGRGLKAWGQMLARSDAFGQCWAKRALTATCLVDPESPQSATAINQLANRFMNELSYDLKKLYANASLMCSG
jgi:hypothetical protein